jgi:hypothetical protein
VVRCLIYAIPHFDFRLISASKERIEFSYQFLDACLVILLYESLIFGNIIVANVKQNITAFIEKEELALPQLKETNIAAVYDLGGVKARLRPAIGKKLSG